MFIISSNEYNWCELRWWEKKYYHKENVYFTKSCHLLFNAGLYWRILLIFWDLADFFICAARSRDMESSLKSLLQLIIGANEHFKFTNNARLTRKHQWYEYNSQTYSLHTYMTMMVYIVMTRIQINSSNNRLELFISLLWKHKTCVLDNDNTPLLKRCNLENNHNNHILNSNKYHSIISHRTLLQVSS